MKPHSRHTNDHEVQPVPGVFEEGELSKTKAPWHNFYGGFKCVDECKHISG